MFTYPKSLLLQKRVLDFSLSINRTTRSCFLYSGEKEEIQFSFAGLS
jgi:hypothetical protein